MIKNKKILIVGAGGFIGGHLTNRLLKNGNSLKNVPLASEPYSFQNSNVPWKNTWKDFVQITL